MKIGFDAKRIFFNYTGLGNYSRSVVSSLLDYYPGDEYFLFTPKVRVKNAAPDLYQRCKVVEPQSVSGKLFPAVWRRMGIEKDILRNHLDIYHGLSHEIPYHLSKSKVRTVVTIHDLIFLRFPVFYKPWDVWNYKKRYLKSCHEADKIIAISENTKRDLIELLNIDEKKISVVYQSVNPVFYEKISEISEKNISSRYNLPDEFILSVGSLNKRKNTSNLVRALAKVKNKNINLVIVGTGSEYNNLVKLIQELNLQKRIYFYSGIANEDLPVFYSKAKVFIYPSFYEGLGLPIIESLLAGTPVITNAGSCFSEAGGEGALYVDVNIPDKIAEAIDYFEDNKIRKEFSLKGKNHVTRFSREEFARGNHKVYEDLIS